MCYQFDHEKPADSRFLKGQSEDCFLNVWTPIPTSTGETTLLPVMVWINGGDFILCSGSELSYNGNQMSKQGNVVVVTLNNRLGILGFMVSDLLAKQDSLWTNLGNYGFLNQNLSGAYSVCYHMIMPKSFDLFKRPIMESGSCDIHLYHHNINKQSFNDKEVQLSSEVIEMSQFCKNLIS